MMKRFSWMIAVGLGTTLSAGAIDALDPRDLDTRTAACSDFNQHANGGWMRNTPVPPGQDRIGSWDLLDTLLLNQRLALLLSLRIPDSDPLDRPLASLINAAFDEPGIASGRSEALQPLLAPIEQLHKPGEIAALVTQYQVRALPMLWRLDVVPDKSGKAVLQLSPRATALADPAYYLSPEPESREILSHYRGYAQALFGALGRTDVEIESAWLLDAEARFARVLQIPDTPVDLSTRELRKRFPDFDWKSMFKGLGLRNPGRIRVAHPEFFAELSRQLKTGPLPMWTAYLRFHLAHALAPWLDAPLREAHDAFFRGVLRGDSEVPSREVQVLAAVELGLPEAFSARYADSAISIEQRAATAALFESLRLQFDQHLQRNRWLGGPNLTLAREKLAALQLTWVQPEPRPELGALQLGGSFARQMLQLAQFRQQQRLQRVGAAPAPALALAQHATLRYVLERNVVEISPALLQLPLLDPLSDAGQRYGALGSLLARELQRAFGGTAAGLGSDGEGVTGWTEAERASFEQFQQKLSEDAAVRLDAGSAMAAQGVAPELAAQLSAVQLAFSALRSNPEGQTSKRIGGLSASQRFFHAYAQVWRENVLSDSVPDPAIPTPALRINALLPHVSGFGESFACKPGNALQRAPGQLLSLWQ